MSDFLFMPLISEGTSTMLQTLQRRIHKIQTSKNADSKLHIQTKSASTHKEQPAAFPWNTSFIFADDNHLHYCQ